MSFARQRRGLIRFPFDTLLLFKNLQPQPEPPTAVNVTVAIAPPSRLPHGARGRAVDGCRPREPLGHRDATAILLAYRHGLRASELVALRWDDINLQPESCTCAAPRAGKQASTR